MTASSGMAARSGSSAASYTLLLRFYYTEGYQDTNTACYGSAGPCDLYGYGKRDWGDAFWKANASSLQTYNSCNATALFREVNYTGRSEYHVGDVPNFPVVNDHLYSFKTWHLNS